MHEYSLLDIQSRIFSQICPSLVIYSWPYRVVLCLEFPVSLSLHTFIHSLSEIWLIFRKTLESSTCWVNHSALYAKNYKFWWKQPCILYNYKMLPEDSVNQHEEQMFAMFLSPILLTSVKYQLKVCGLPVISDLSGRRQLIHKNVTWIFFILSLHFSILSLKSWVSARQGCSLSRIEFSAFNNELQILNFQPKTLFSL